MTDRDIGSALYDAREYLIAGLENQAEWWEHLGDAHRDYAALARAIEELGFLDEVGRLHRMVDVVTERDRVRDRLRDTIQEMEVARDDADFVLRWLRQTDAPDNIIRLQVRALEALGGCVCNYELVEDGAVQRVRWFHEPGCPRG